MKDTTIKKTEKALRDRIKALEIENRKLRLEINKLKSSSKGFYTLKKQIDGSVDLGEFTHRLPPCIPEHKKWCASDYPNDWSPEEKASDYLLTFWKNYPVSQSYFSNVRGGQSFYKYLKRNDLFRLIPNSFQLELKKRFGQVQ